MGRLAGYRRFPFSVCQAGGESRMGAFYNLHVGIAEGISRVKGGLPGVPSSQGLWSCSVSEGLQKEVRLPRLARAAWLVGNEPGKWPSC